MIKGIGTDIVEIKRVKRLMENQHAIDRLLTKDEAKLMETRPKPHEFFAGRFASKEAISKAFGVGISKCPPNEIEVLNDDLGAPYVVLCGAAKKLQENLNVTNIYISISHEKEYAMATVVLEGDVDE